MSSLGPDARGRNSRESCSRDALLDDLSCWKRKGPAASHVEDQVGWITNQQESVEWRVRVEVEVEVVRIPGEKAKGRGNWRTPQAPGSV